MSKFVRWIDIKAPRDKVFAFHLRPHNLTLIAHPATKTSLVSTTDRVLTLGSRVTVRTVQGGMQLRMEAEVIQLDPPRLLQDRQIHGPFSKWVHTHRFEPTAEGTRLIDQVEYTLPFGPLGSLVGHSVARELETVFAYRQEHTRLLLEGDPANLPT